SSDGSTGRLLPLSLSPVSQISHIEVRDGSSQLVLQGTLQPGGGDVGGGDVGDDVTFAGPIEALPDSGLIGDWHIGGKTVHVSSSTEIRQDVGSARVGIQVEVRGSQQQDGAIVATRIEVLEGSGGGGGGGGGGDETRFAGFIESLPSGDLIGDWRVA